ncbi:uncharacterized protein LDX57_001956 [Aspergillus melleus]|uniref:uncharacterized protein n=1 Tax=Aspergillus melleus TaxID=138277 RepID=UPI001E8E41E6|nr:uncharacterized protein LDX57_001956 [Aspergillus melleus]KAH8424199.1 hypothetical protein LDX57_001956 [Aspergillus melleus]
MGTWRGTIIAWNVETGERMIDSDKGYDYTKILEIEDIQFSSSSQLMGAVTVSKSVDKRTDIEVWNMQTGHLVKMPHSVVFQDTRLQDNLNLLERELCHSRREERLENKTSTKHARPSQKHCIQLDEDWIILGEQKSIWLPLEYRPAQGVYKPHKNSTRGIFGDTLAIGSASGQVLFSGFSPDGLSAEQLAEPLEESDDDEF